MAIYKIKSKKSSTIWNNKPNNNTGLDPILYLYNGLNVYSNTYDTSRILIQFDSINIPSYIPIQSSSFYLGLENSEAHYLPNTYNLIFNEISGSWDSGLGTLYSPSTQGVTWKNRDNNKWQTSSFSPNTTSSFLSSNPGGGVWFTSSVSQSYDVNSSNNIYVNINNISSSIFNQGIIIRTENDLSSSSYYNLSFYSNNTHTIYQPYIDIKWNDFIYNTGSLPIINDDNLVVLFYNNKGTFKNNEVYNFKLNVRPLYPQRAFVTSSVYNNNYVLPSSSYWAVQDVINNNFIFNFDNVYTNISCNSSGSNFTFYFDNIPPYRWYKFIFKVVMSNGEILILDNNYNFYVNG